MDTTSSNQELPVMEMTAVTVGSIQDPGVPVLEDVNWTVSAGDFWVIAGLQGSGKTDMLHMTAGLMPPQAGLYRLFGLEMPIYDEELKKERLRLGLVFDGGRLLHELTILENVALPLRYHRARTGEESADRVKQMMELTGLAESADKLPGAVGRNWQKRAALARALILEPEILLLDHPLGGLDPRQSAWWIDFLNQLSAGHSFMNGRPITLVVTVENLRPWRNFAGHFALLQKRRFKPLGRCRELAGHAEPLVKELLAEDNSSG